jgi:hypothetical protein
MQLRSHSEAIFATSNLVGVAYAPRFKNLALS